MPEVSPSPDYIPGLEGPPSPDYVPGPEEPEQAPPPPIYIPFVSKPVYPEFLPVDDEMIDDDDVDDDAEGRGCPSDPSEMLYHSHVHATEMPEICFLLISTAFRVVYSWSWVKICDDLGESSAAGAARQVGPTTTEADLYGFADMLDATLGRQTSKELGYGITIHGMTLQEPSRRLQRPPRGGIGNSSDAQPSDRGGGQISRDTWERSAMVLAISIAKSRLSETETVSGDPKDSEEPQGSDDRASETAGTCS
ncbi:hypothetical protein Tco_0353075 [Tanacetum coccineum]